MFRSKPSKGLLRVDRTPPMRLFSATNSVRRQCAIEWQPTEEKISMKRSTERILTSHVGSLARADSLIPLLRLREQGQPYDRDDLARRVREAVTDVVGQQVEAGIDIVADGEQGESSFYGYVVERFSGFEGKPPTPGNEMRPRAAGREYLAFPELLRLVRTHRRTVWRARRARARPRYLHRTCQL